MTWRSQLRGELARLAINMWPLATGFVEAHVAARADKPLRDGGRRLGWVAVRRSNGDFHNHGRRARHATATR